MTLPTTPDIEWISNQTRDILMYFKSFSVVHYLYRSYKPIKIRKSWQHLFSDEYINAVFAESEKHKDTTTGEIFKRIGYAMLQWRPLILHFKESFAFTRKYTSIGKRISRRPIKQSKYLKQIQGDFEKIRQLYRTVGDPLQKRPEQIFLPGLNGHTPSIGDLCDQFLKENTPQYKNVHQVELAEFQKAKLIAPGFRMEKWKRVLPYLEKNLGLEMPNSKNFRPKGRRTSQNSWVIPMINENSIDYKIIITPESGPSLASLGLHELGHAIQYMNMPVQVSFLDRFVGDNFLTETIADLFSSLATKPKFLREVWNMPSALVEPMARSSQRLTNFSIQKHALDLKFRIKLFTEDWDIIEAQDIYHNYLQEYMGLSTVAINNFHIAFRPFLPGDYFLANIYSHRLENELQKIGGKMWWQSREAGGWLRDHWFHFGLANPLPYPEWIK